MDFKLLNLLRAGVIHSQATRDAFANKPAACETTVCRQAQNEAFAVNKHRSLTPSRRKAS
jgi:hypothetical protein